jgi:hypothetical protein
MRRSAVLLAVFGLAAPAAQAQVPNAAYHVQLQINRYSEEIGLSGVGSCRIATGVIGTFPDSAGRLAIGTPVDLTVPCGRPGRGSGYSTADLAGAQFLDARLAGAPGGGFAIIALQPRAVPSALPSAAAPQPIQQQVLVAPPPPVVIRSPNQPSMPLPVNPVAPSRPLVLGQQQAIAPTVVPAPPGPAFVPQPPGYTPAPRPVVGDTATMRPDAAIVITYGAASAAETGRSQRIVTPTDPAYPGLLSQLGGIAPGQTKPLPRPVAAVPLVPNAVGGGKLRSLVVGNSLAGTDLRYNRQGAWTEYYDPSGVVTRSEANRRQVGSWAIRGDALCTRYPGQAETCLTLSTTATALRGYAGATLVALDLRILPGNAIPG